MLIARDGNEPQRAVGRGAEDRKPVLVVEAAQRRRRRVSRAALQQRRRLFRRVDLPQAQTVVGPCGDEPGTVFNECDADGVVVDRVVERFGV